MRLGALPLPDSVSPVVYSAVMKASERQTWPIPDRASALNQERNENFAPPEGDPAGRECVEKVCQEETIRGGFALANSMIRVANAGTLSLAKRPVRPRRSMMRTRSSSCFWKFLQKSRSRTSSRM